MAGSIVLLYGGVAGHIALACGFITPLFPGFAKADGQERVQEQVIELRLESIETTMWNLRIKQCEALNAARPTVMLTEKLRGLHKKYEQLTGRLYALPDCRELAE